MANGSSSILGHPASLSNYDNHRAHPEPERNARGGEGGREPRPQDTPLHGPAPIGQSAKAPPPRASIRRAGPAVGGDWSPSLGSAAVLGAAAARAQVSATRRASRRAPQVWGLQIRWAGEDPAA